MKFYISVEEVRSTVVKVEAESLEKAIQKVEKAYSEDEVCLDDASYIDDGTTFYDETDRWGNAASMGLVNFHNIL